MQSALDTAVRYMLAVMLFFIALGNFMNAFVSPEAFFLFSKLEAASAIIYLIVNGSTALVLSILMLRGDLASRCFLTSIYFGFHLLNSLIVSLRFFGVPAFSTISLIGLILSLIPLVRGLVLR